VSKRTLTAVIILTFLAGGVIGGLIGYKWHAPGRPSTWANIRAWATLAVLVLGFTVAAYELNLQRRQFADQARRSIARDDLLDRQRRELQDREQLRQREQAEEINLTWTRDGPGSFAQVINDSRRPIRDITCQIKPSTDSKPPVPAERAAEMVCAPRITPGDAWMMPPDGVPEGDYVPVIRGSRRAGFGFISIKPEQDGSRLLTRFTDDAGLHWELDNYLHLERIPGRDDL
jgi:hypothetical protein